MRSFPFGLEGGEIAFDLRTALRQGRVERLQLCDLSRRRVERETVLVEYGGELRVDRSEELGGARFEVRLPLPR